MNEIKVIPGYENYGITKSGVIYNIKTKRKIKTYIGNNGYECTALWVNNKSRTLLVHRLMAISYFDDFDDELCVHHIDSNRVNNSLSNLECVTYKQNSNYVRSKPGKGRISKLKILKMYKTKKWESVEEFMLELIKM